MGNNLKNGKDMWILIYMYEKIKILMLNMTIARYCKPHLCLEQIWLFKPNFKKPLAQNQ